MDEELPPIMAGEKGTLKTDTTFTKASIKQKFKAIRWSSFRKSKHKRPAVLQEVPSLGFENNLFQYNKMPATIEYRLTFSTNQNNFHKINFKKRVFQK